MCGVTAVVPSWDIIALQIRKVRGGGGWHVNLELSHSIYTVFGIKRLGEGETHVVRNLNPYHKGYGDLTLIFGEVMNIIICFG